ncbi:hypothetical protein [Microbispora rosea]|uniref:Lipopolysaccharide assembly protein A domain-containing protein n=1 Tax=Microbispora rosea TaxID=58117 RepID=A0A1N7HES9_9ACTN|nr:hypothetical protein [Microbispora rosea]GIH52714.1 hypothetical protein Mro03_78930 [Microbispora rosea subsp. rosea]SIS23384.1 hypothetical protein SAMN05421833_14649 [Microbispora rosea]
MVLLGLLLVLIAAAAVIEVSVNDTANTMPITVLDRTFNLSPFELFIAGVVTAAVFVAGLLLITGGMRRAAVKRRRLREARLAERDRVSRLEAEKRDLERRLETTPTASTTPTSTPKVDRDGDGVDDRTERAEQAERPTAPHNRLSIPAQQSSSDQLVAGGRHAADDRRA